MYKRVYQFQTENDISCIFKHPLMNLNDFNSNYLNDLLDKVSKEQKSVFLLGDFVVSNSFVPNILQPT